MEMVAEKGQASAPVWWRDGAVGPTYPVIYADPPWKFVVRSEVTGRDRSAENHYPTMNLDDVLALGCPAARDAVLFLWVTDLANGLACMEAWGFAYKSFWGWEKVYPGRQTGTGYWSFDNCELLLIGTRGSPPAPLPGTQPLKLTAHPVSEHSAKPDFHREQIERLYPGVSKLEMFARAARPGWDVWGFEAGVAPDATSEAPVELSKAENAGELSATAAPRQEADAITASLPPEPTLDEPVEISVEGMKRGSHARLTIYRNEDGSFAIAAAYQISGLGGGASPRTGTIPTFAKALDLGLEQLETRLSSTAAETSSVCTDRHRAIARAGLKWIKAKRLDWGLA